MGAGRRIGTSFRSVEYYQMLSIYMYNIYSDDKFLLGIDTGEGCTKASEGYRHNMPTCYFIFFF